MINYYRKFDEDSFENDWREYYLDAFTVLPLICLVVDMMMNKIRIRFSQIYFTIFFNALFLFSNFIYQKDTYLNGKMMTKKNNKKYVYFIIRIYR